MNFFCAFFTLRQTLFASRLLKRVIRSDGMQKGIAADQGKKRSFSG
jgi:hypothetical protein